MLAPDLCACSLSVFFPAKLRYQAPPANDRVTPPPDFVVLMKKGLRPPNRHIPTAPLTSSA